MAHLSGLKCSGGDHNLKTKDTGAKSIRERERAQALLLIAFLASSSLALSFLILLNLKF